MLISAFVVGLAAGLGAVFFRWLIQSFHNLFFVGLQGPLSFLGSYYTWVLPVIGGLLVGALTYWGAREAKGHGVPEIMEAVFLRGGAIRPRVAIVKSLASAICIGSGGSVGREGPIAQIGAAVGSTLGQFLQLPNGRLRTLVACGAAGGIAATFNAPLAGAFFALEIILTDWQAEAFAPVVVASVTSGIVGRMAFGNVAAFEVPQYSVSAFGQLPMFLLLGLAAGLMGVAFTRFLYLAEDTFEKLPVPPWLLPAVGGILVGAIGLYDHELYGVGYGAISQALAGARYTLLMLVAMAAFKLLATGTMIGSGGSGGVFAPSLFIGSMLGAALGHLNNHLMPQSGVLPGAFALAGMGSMFAATSHAPITATLIVFELTGDYRMILPLMLACGVSVVTSRSIFRFSIYNLKLVRRGVHVTLKQDTRLLNEIYVQEVMTADVVTLSPDATVKDAVALLEDAGHHGFPLVDAEGHLRGLVTARDLRGATADMLDRPVSEFASHDLTIAFPSDTLNDALRKLGLRDVARLPVVDRDDHRRFLGMVTRKDVVDAYGEALADAHTRLEETQDEEHFD